MTAATPITRQHLARSVVAVVLFSIAFAYVESAVVVYLRMIYEPIRTKHHPGRPPGELFPLITIDQLHAEGNAHERGLLVELGREFATLIMLGGIAAACARTRGQWFAFFMIAFGVWDIFFYVWLKACIDWPASIWQWDILFLLPVVWAGPVISPVLVSVSMILAGGIILWHERGGGLYRPGRGSGAGILAGALVIIVAFCWDYRYLSAGNLPRAFPWWLFAIGEGVGLGSFVIGLRTCATRNAVAADAVA
jgi:hypothetical protein